MEYVLVLSLVAITLIPFWQAGSFGFTNWDDDKYVTDAQIIRNFSFNEAFTTPTVGLYTPLTTLSYMLDYQFFGLDPKAYHVENILLHILCCLLVYRVSKLLLKHSLSAFVVAAIFAVHPLHVEPVVWISSRKDLLFTIFYLMAMIKYLQFLEKKKALDYWLCFSFFLLSCLAKPTAVSLPLVLVVLEWFRSSKISMPNWKRIVPMLLVSLAFGMVTIMVTKSLGLRSTPDGGYSFWQIFHFAAYGLGFYIIRFFWPTHLANYHAYPLPEMDLPWDYLIAPWVALALFGLVILSWKREPRILFAFLMFLMVLAPNYRFLPIGFPMVADRYGYLSSLGLLLIIGLLTAKRKANSPFLIGTVLILILLTRSSFLQVQTWKTSIDMWNRTITLYPYAYFPLQKRGESYVAKADKVKALKDYVASLSVMPENPSLANSASLILFDLGELNEALRYQDLAVKLDSNAIYLYNRGNTYKALKNHQKAIEDYDRSIDLNPELASAYNNRGVCHIMTGDTTAAFSDFKQAVSLDPENNMYKENYERAIDLLK